MFLPKENLPTGQAASASDDNKDSWAAGGISAAISLPSPVTESIWGHWGDLARVICTQTTNLYLELLYRPADLLLGYGVPGDEGVLLGAITSEPSYLLDRTIHPAERTSCGTCWY